MTRNGRERKTRDVVASKFREKHTRPILGYLSVIKHALSQKKKRLRECEMLATLYRGAAAEAAAEFDYGHNEQ